MAGPKFPTPAPAPGVNPPVPPPPLPLGKQNTVKVTAKSHTTVATVVASSAFIPEIKSTKHEDYVRAKTKGLITPLLNGRDEDDTGPAFLFSEPLDAMEAAIRLLGTGDSVYLASWFFEPATPLTSGTAFKGATTWGAFFSQRAQDGVKIRIIINDFDPISGSDSWLKTDSLDPLEKIVRAIPAAFQDNLKYCVSMHPASVGNMKSLMSGQGNRKIFVGSHHQKFMVTKKVDELTAFCGGVDIESRKAPVNWVGNAPVWHDVHFQVEGPIAYDLEGEFVMRWNLEKDANAKNLSLKGWKGMETLAPSTISAKDNAAAKKVHDVQMLRTISLDAILSPFDTKRDDIIQVYRNVVHTSQKYLYLENQYFRDQTLADKIAARAKANDKLVAIFVVVASAGDDDGDNAVTKHGDYLQNLFFKKVSDAFGKKRCGIYTMLNRAVHAKIMIVDDQIIEGGSANANARSFAMDSELNISVDDATLVTAFRKRLWGHNLGATPAEVTAFADFVADWDKVADANAKLMAKPDDTKGECVLKFDFTKTKGEKSLLIPDELSYMDFDDKPGKIGEAIELRGGKIV